jgi:hypothetical protein
VSLDILDVVELGGERIVDVNDDDLPVSLALVEQSHDTEDLDLLDLTGLGDELTNLADVERVVVTLSLGLGVGDVGVLPGLDKPSAELQCVNSSHIPGGRRRSSRGNPCEGSSCGRSGACPSWCPA